MRFAFYVVAILCLLAGVLAIITRQWGWALSDLSNFAMAYIVYALLDNPPPSIEEDVPPMDHAHRLIEAMMRGSE